MMDLMYKAPSDESIVGQPLTRNWWKVQEKQSLNTENCLQRPEEAIAAAARKKNHRKLHRETVQK